MPCQIITKVLPKIFGSLTPIILFFLALILSELLSIKKKQSLSIFLIQGPEDAVWKQFPHFPQNSNQF